MKRFFRDYGLSIVLFLLFFFSWGGQFFTQLSEVKSNAQTHGQEFQWTDFWAEFGAATFENWQSEFLQLFSFVVLTSFLIHKGSSESKDGDEKMRASLKRIEKQLAQIQGGGKRR